MSQNILEVKDLHVSVQDKEILKGVDLAIGSGETHVLMGPNGAGKSTLGFALMGNPRYEVTEGEIIFNGQNIEDEPADKRARAGMFMSFQNPVEVPGLSVSSFIRSAIEQRTGKRPLLFKFRKELDSKMDALHIERSYAERDLNVGFSGGEKKKAEILQLHMLAPSLAILDETDSGLDVDAVRIVSEGIRAYQEEKKGSLLIITHNAKILESLHVDHTYVIVDGKIAAEGGAELIEQIGSEGFAAFEG